jgi:alternate signal-mediated exported protein
MKKSTKGALAAAAAGTLLLGGAGSLAFWNATATVDGSTVNAGSLVLDGEDCSDWVLDNGEVVGGADLADSIVPGDQITKTCTYTITATGDHLRATLDADGGDETGSLAGVVTVTPSFDVGGSPVTEITEDNDGDTLTAKIVLDFPYGATADNTSQLGNLDLTDYVVTATQVHS